MKRFLIPALAIVAMNASAQSSPDFTGTYPTTRQMEQKDVFFGTEVSDPYRWL